MATVGKIKLLKFFEKNAGEILPQLVQKTLFEPKTNKENQKLIQQLAELKRRPFPSQVEKGVLPIYKSLMTYGFGILNAEMGTGKTQMSFSAAFLALKNMPKKRNKICFFTSGGKHLPIMKKEALEIFGKDKIEILTIVNKNGGKLKKGEIEAKDVASYQPPKGKIVVFLLSKDTAKMGIKKEKAFNWGSRCPSCGTKLLPSNFKKKVKDFEKKMGLKWTEAPDLFFKNLKGLPKECRKCGDPLEAMVAQHNGNPNYVFPMLKKGVYSKTPRKLPIGKILRRNKKGKIFDVAIIDEVHEFQGKDTLQSQAYRDLVKVSAKSIVMTGTMANGYSSSIFYILYGIMPRQLREEGYDYHKLSLFVEHYGAKENLILNTPNGNKNLGFKELPIINDRIVSLLAPYTAWVKMEDLNLPMPSYTEKAVIVDPGKELSEKTENFRKKVVKALYRTRSENLLRSFAQRFMYLLNNPTLKFCMKWEGQEIYYEKKALVEKEVKMSICFDEYSEDTDIIFPKEQKLIESVSKDFKQGRGVLVYTIFNGIAKVDQRLEKVLKRAFPDKNIKRMPENISGEKIQTWIDNNPCDLLIASPLKLSTGFNLIQFPSIKVYESGTNLRVLQQAVRRSWRAVGQKHPVEVEFYAYQGLQAQILDIMGKKARAAAVVEGRKVEHGQLASVYDSDSEYTEALNNIANVIEEKFKPDFSSNNIPAGKLRPATNFEIFVENIYKDFDNKKGGEGENKKTTSSKKETKEEVVVGKVAIDVTLPKKNFVKIRKEVKRQQLSFNF